MTRDNFAIAFTNGTNFTEGKTWHGEYTMLVAFNLNNHHFPNHEIIDSVSMHQTNPFHLHHHVTEKIQHYLLKSQHLQNVPCLPAIRDEVMKQAFKEWLIKHYF